MEPNTEKINWRRLVITVLLIVIASAVTSSITWFLLDRTFNATQQSNAALIETLEKKITFLDTKLSSSSGADTSETEAANEAAVRKVVDNLEVWLRDAHLNYSEAGAKLAVNNIFNLFTEPLTTSDINLESTLKTGKDSSGNPGGPTLFGSNTASGYTSSYSITDLKKVSDYYLVTVNENRVNYSATSGSNVSSARVVQFKLVKEGSSWLIDEYYRSGGSGKYDGFLG